MSQPTGVAVVGVGYWGPNWVRVLTEHPGADLRAVCDRSPGRREFISQRYPDLPVVEGVEALLNDPTISAIVLVTPVSTHESIGRAILQAGKHLLVEKPLASSSEAAARLNEDASAGGLVLAVGHIFTYHPAVRRMVKEIRNGAIGDLLYTHSNRMNLGPPGSDVDVIWDLAVHDLSIMHELKKTEAVAVRATGRSFTHAELIDAALITTEFADGTFASHHVGWHTPERVRDFFVAGTAGSMHFDDTRKDGKLRLIDAGVDTRIGANPDSVRELSYAPGEVRELELDAEEPLVRQCTEFLEAIAGSGGPTSDGRSGLAVVRLIEAAERSIAAGGERVTLADSEFSEGDRA